MTAWYFCNIFHLEGSQSALQAKENKEITFLLVKCSHLQVRMQQAIVARKTHPCFEERVAFSLQTHLRHHRWAEHWQTKVSWTLPLATSTTTPSPLPLPAPRALFHILHQIATT